MILEKEKLKWLDEIGAVDISKYQYEVPANHHKFSLEYLKNNKLDKIKQDYALLYSKFT